MPGEAQSEHSQVVLLVGEAPSSLRGHIESAQPQNHHVLAVNDIYAAGAMLLKSARLPAAVLVLIETLRGDELRFFDLLARRWPALPVAAVSGESQDRRLDVCRRKGVAVITAGAAVEWLSQRPQPAVPPVAAPPASPADSSAEPPADPLARQPEPLVEDHGQDLPSHADRVHHQATPAQPDPNSSARGVVRDDAHPQDAAECPAELAIHQLPEESFVDLPDELVAHLPDHLDEDPPEEAPAHEEPSEAFLEQELPLVGEDDDEMPEPAEADEAGESIERVPLTPWSGVPRMERRRPVRRPPTVDEAPLAAGHRHDADGDLAPEHTGYTPQDTHAQPSGRTQSENGALPDYGLLTPEELRALLQEPQEEDDSGEVQS